MIGNYLYCLKENNLATVSNIYGASGLVDLKEVETGMLQPRLSLVLACLPVLLSPEILEKCPELVCEYLGYGTTQYKMGYLQLQTLNDGEYHLSYKCCHLSNPKYLHTFQNIIHALTGSHLKVEL